MAKLTLSDIGSLTNETTALSTLNANNALIVTALENTLSRDGTTPNTMSSNLDMNSHHITNLPIAVNPTDPVRLQEVGDAPGYATAAAASAATSTAQAVIATTQAGIATTQSDIATTQADTATTQAGIATTQATAAAASATVVAGNFYTFDSSTVMGDPGSAKVRFNNATVASVTALAFSVNTADSGNPSIRTFLSTWGSSSTTIKGIITIRKVGTPATFAVFNVTAAVTDNTTWEQVTVTYVSGNGTFSASDNLSVQFTKSGNDGSMSGPGVSVDSEIALFSGTGGATLKRASQTGILKGTSGVIGTATSGTDYQAPIGTISGLAKGNGANLLTAAVANTDYLPVASPTTTGTLTAATVAVSGVITAGAKGHTLGQASGTAATGAVAVGDSNIILYGTGTNWSGIGTDNSGHMWFKVGTSGTPVPAMYLHSTNQNLVFANSPVDANGTIFSNIPQNSQSAAYTLVLADANKHILHPSADTTARVFTIPANASVAYPIGTAITFINQNAGGVITIAITTDTMRLAGPGTTGSRTLAANGMATAIKITSTEWIISGTGLT